MHQEVGKESANPWLETPRPKVAMQGGGEAFRPQPMYPPKGVHYGSGCCRVRLGPPGVVLGWLSHYCRWWCQLGEQEKLSCSLSFLHNMENTFCFSFAVFFSKIQATYISQPTKNKAKQPLLQEKTQQAYVEQRLSPLLFLTHTIA